ncbi:MAG: tetratricopeptide repeat protein [Deltaproteobacteria bacterium]|nr:tetratricopeptide repeat protein [Deltaproteobacteria bacterium]MCW5806559.1 tetratricopeptide repeat protein [Deltaproteobacteria bacterium]
MPRRAVTVAALVAWALAARGAEAAPGQQLSPAQQLASARDDFARGDWTGARLKTNDLLYPDLKLARRDDVIEANILYGAAAYELKDLANAEKAFHKALQLDPELEITTMRFSEGAVKLFEEVKRDRKRRAEQDAANKRIADRLAAIEAYRKTLRVYEVHPYYVNFIPFGAGQFQNGQAGRGYFFAASQGATFLTSLGIFIYLGAKYGLVAKVPLDEGPRVRTLQQAEIISGAAFFALYAIGVFDSIRHYTPRRQVKGDDSILPDDLKPEEPAPSKKPSPKKKTSLRDRLKLGPILTPGGAGIGLSLESP